MYGKGEIKMRTVIPFKFWSQKILPLVYDDSLSYYEVLCKLKDKINEVILSYEDVQVEIEEFINSPEFEAWLKLYIESRKTEISSLAVIGDSNAEGYGWWGGNVLDKTSENDGYCAVLRELYPDAVIDNYSSTGALLRGSTGNVAKEQCDALIRSQKQYEYIIIQVGMNDLGTIMGNTDNIVGYCPSLKSTAMTIADYSSCVRSLITIINRLRVYSPNAKIIYLVREYQASGSPYLYPMYCAFFKQIFETCYLMNVPILNLETDYINSDQNSSNYFDTIHWNENAYRNYVTPRLIEFINHPVTSGLISNEYMFLCCNVADIFRGESGNAYSANDVLKGALNYIVSDSVYFSFNGTFLLTGLGGTMAHGSITCINPYVVANIKRAVNDRGVTIFKNNDVAEYYIEHISNSPSMSSNTSYSGAEVEGDNENGYGCIPGGQAVFHQAYNDKNGLLARLFTGAKSGQMFSLYNPANNTRNDFFLGGMLGTTGTIALDDQRIQNGVYYVPYTAVANVTKTVPDSLRGGYGYVLIVNRQLTGSGNYSVIFAITLTGVYYMLNYDENWIPLGS